MKAIELLLDLITAFTLKRWFSLVVIIATLWASVWILDSYTSYTKLNRIERAIGFIERLDTLERKGNASEGLSAAREKALNEVSALLEAVGSPSNAAVAPDIPWYNISWVKFLSGALPWFIISLFAVPAIIKREKNSLPAFFALQLFTIIFGFVNFFIPPTGRFWIDHILAPWGVFFVCIIIPTSIAAVAAFRKVRDSSQRKAIMNNLRQLAAASNQYYLETGHTQVTYEQLVGPEPTKYIKSIQSVDGERYDLIDFTQGQPLMALRRSGEIVKYEN